MSHIIKRKLPVGLVAASLDWHTFGEWPGAIECQSCIGTGNFYGRDEDGDWLDCDDCQARGWNPPPGGPVELIVRVTTTLETLNSQGVPNGNSHP